MYIIIAIFIIIVFFTAFKGYFYSNKKLRLIRKEIGKVIVELEAREINRKAIENLNIINEIFEENSVLLKKEWDSYYMSIKNEENVNKLLNPEFYFNTQRIFDKHSKRKIAEAMPSILTGIGIFGTFTGLMYGLWGLRGLEIEVLREEIPVLISGMTISFSSSLVAILCSLIFSVLDKRLISEITNNLEILNNKLNNMLPVRIESNLLNEVVDNQQKQLKATNEFVSDTLIPELVNGLQEAVDKTITPQMNQMNHIVERLAEVSSSRQAESIDKMVNKFMDTFNESFDYQFDALKETLEEVIDWQKNTKSEMEELINTIEQNAQRQNQLLNSTNDLMKNMRDYIDEFDEFHSKLNTNISSLNQISSELNNLEDQVNNKLATMIEEYENLQKLKDEERDKMQQQIEEINKFWSSIRDNFGDLNNNLENAMEQFANNTYKGLDRTFEQFDDNLSKITSRLGANISEINEMVDQVPDSINQLIRVLSEFDSDQKEILEKVESANNTLEEMQENKGLFSRFGGNRG